MHLVQLEQAQSLFEAKGIRVASITYDSQAILKDFSERKGITCPMLSDIDSKIIHAFGILNPEGKGFAAGIPYPGIYLISPAAAIRGSARCNPGFSIRRDRGNRIKLLVKIDPATHIHSYAPGAEKNGYNFLPGICPYKGLYFWIDLRLPDNWLKKA